MRAFAVYLWIIVAGVALFFEPARELWVYQEATRTPIMNILFLSLIGVYIFHANGEDNKNFRR